MSTAGMSAPAAWAVNVSASQNIAIVSTGTSAGPSLAGAARGGRTSLPPARWGGPAGAAGSGGRCPGAGRSRVSLLSSPQVRLAKAAVVRSSNSASVSRPQA
jgi:hypothetical protein